MSIDFDGTSDGLTADVSALSGGLLFAQGFFSYDAGLNNRTIFRYLSSTSNDEIHLYKNGVTLTLFVLDASGPVSTNITAAITSVTWYGYQVYVDAIAAGVGLRVWTTGAPPAFTTGTGRTITGLDTFTLGYDGSGQFLNGREAGLYLADYYPSITAAADWNNVVNRMAIEGHPLGVLPSLHKHLSDDGSTVGMYWRMQDDTDLTDVLQGKLLTAVNSPGSSVDGPRIRRKRRQS